VWISEGLVGLGFGVMGLGFGLVGQALPINQNECLQLDHRPLSWKMEKECKSRGHRLQKGSKCK